jgi:Rhs element Vgr protein
VAKTRFFLEVNNKTLNVTRLNGHENVNLGFQYNITAESPSPVVTNSLLANATVIFSDKNNSYREQTGIITAVTNLGVFNNKHRYKIHIQDRLSTLKNTSNSKVFITVNVQDVLNYLAQKAGYSSGQIVFRTSSALPHLKQCVQAMESDWAFFNRLMSQHGLFYWIESESSTETLVISDSNLNSPYLSTGVLEVKANAGMNAQYWGSFVGFMHSEVTQTLYNNAAQSNAHGQFQKVASNSQSFFEPAANSNAEASAQTQNFSNALATHNKLVTLTGNVPDVFAGCSISLDDNMGFASGDLLCIAIEHTLNQANDESSHEGETHYHCVAQFIERGTPFKPMPESHTPKPMVFPATVESLTSNAFVDEHGQYRIRNEFDKTARPLIQSSPALKKLALYACENQPQATGWHFPLVGGSEVLIGCINNDPNNTFIMGFALNADQPSVVTAANPTHNRLLSAAQNELMFDDDKDVPKVILQTLASEHYIELNAKKSGRQFIQWISQLGTINLHAGRDLCLETEQANVQFVIKNNQFIDVKNTVSQTTNNNHVNYQSGGSQTFSGKNTTLKSEKEISLFTGRALKVNAQSDILLKTDNSDLKLNVPTGSTFLQTNNNINITGSGNGDLIIHNVGGEIKLDSQGNVDITATNVLTLDGTFITFDGPVDYDITSPKTARAPSNASPASIASITDFDISESGIATAQDKVIELSYFYDDGLPVEDISYVIDHAKGGEYKGQLLSGVATIQSVPTGNYSVTYQGTTDDELDKLRADLRTNLNAMVKEIRAQAKVQEALIDQENIAMQGLIYTGAFMTGLYEQGSSIVSGVGDFLEWSGDSIFDFGAACLRILEYLARGDVEALRHECEQILESADNTFDAIADGFKTLVMIAQDEEARALLASFPYDYFDAHSSVEKVRLVGKLALEILLALVTFGAGAIVSAVSKSRYFVKAAQAIQKLTEAIKLKRLNHTRIGNTEQQHTDRIEKVDDDLTPGAKRRRPEPQSLKEAMLRLEVARENLLKYGYVAKYSDDELIALANSGSVINERFHVRFMESSYLEYQGKPGMLGAPFQGESGFGAKYWSTTFDQLESADSDPEIISKVLGLDYNPKNDYSLVIIDTQQAHALADTKSIVPTYGNLNKFAREELSEKFTPEQLDTLLTPKFQAKYNELYSEALNSGVMEAEWDTEGALKYFSNLELTQNEIDLIKKRLEMQRVLGNNQHFLGNGLTKSLLEGTEYGAVETFNFERKLINLEQFGDSLNITPVIKPLNLGM